jgi:hypothetical protein
MSAPDPTAAERLRRIQNRAMEHMNCYGCPTPWWLKHELSRDIPVAATPDASSVDTDAAAVGDVEALAEELWGTSNSPGAAPTDVDRDLARRILASDWLRDLLDAARREGGAEAMREVAADMVWDFEDHPVTRAAVREWLSDQAARYGGAR